MKDECLSDAWNVKKGDEEGKVAAQNRGETGASALIFAVEEMS